MNNTMGITIGIAAAAVAVIGCVGVSRYRNNQKYKRIEESLQAALKVFETLKPTFNPTFNPEHEIKAADEEGLIESFKKEVGETYQRMCVLVRNEKSGLDTSRLRLIASAICGVYKDFSHQSHDMSESGQRIKRLFNEVNGGEVSGFNFFRRVLRNVDTFNHVLDGEGDAFSPHHQCVLAMESIKKKRVGDARQHYKKALEFFKEDGDAGMIRRVEGLLGQLREPEEGLLEQLREPT